METLARALGALKSMPSLLRGRLHIWKTKRIAAVLWIIHRHHRPHLPRVLRLHRLRLLHRRRHRHRQVRNRPRRRVRRQTLQNHHLPHRHRWREFQVARMPAGISRSVPCILIQIRMENVISLSIRKQLQTSLVLSQFPQRRVIRSRQRY